MAAELPQRLKQQLGAILEIAPNREVPMVKEAIENGFYRGGLSLLDAQKALINFSDFRELETGLKTKDTYNPDDFNKVLNGLMNNKGALYERVKLAVWNNDLKYLDPTAIDRSPRKPITGELTPPHPESIPPKKEIQPAQQESLNKKPIPGEEKKIPPPSQRQATGNEETTSTDERTPSSQPLQEQGRNQQSPRSQQPTPQAPLSERKSGKLPKRTIDLGQRISKVNRKVSAEPRRLNPLPRRMPYVVRSAGLSAASQGNILARKGLTRALGGLGGLMNNLPGGLGNFLGLGGNGAPFRRGPGRIGFPGFLGRKGGRTPELGKSGTLENIAKGSSKKWLLIFLILFLAFVFIYNLIPGYDSGTSETADTCARSITALKEVTGLTKDPEGFYISNNGEVINYVITVSSKTSCGKDFIIEDVIGENADPVIDSISDGGIIEGKKITWKFPTLVSTKKLTYSVTPNKSDTWVVNEATIRYTGQAGTSGYMGGTIAPAQALELEKKAQAVLGGQGRTDPARSEEAFVKTIIDNVGDFYKLKGREDHLVIIYRTFRQYNVNPFLGVMTWKTETGFSVACGAGQPCDRQALSCPRLQSGVKVTSFEAQVDCAASVYDERMTEFEQNQKDGVAEIPQVDAPFGGKPTGVICYYNDPLMYAMARYGPLCHSPAEPNPDYWSNFPKLYNELRGIQ